MAKNDILQAEKNTEVQEDEMPILWKREFQSRRFQTGRRQQCDECGKRFTTYEKIETEPLSVIKKDKTRQLYDRSKIRNGIVQSCHKLPVSMGQIEAAIDEIETKIYNMGTREVESSVIGEMVMDKLKDLNEVAYVRFAAIYREFKDVNTFMSELKKLLK